LSLSLTNPDELSRNYTMRMSVPACKLHVGDLKRLYQLIEVRQTEIRNRLLGGMYQQDQESQDLFQARVDRVRNAFLTTVTITGMNGGVVTSHGEAIFESGAVQERVSSILYDTSYLSRDILSIYPDRPDDAAIGFLKTRPSGLQHSTV